MDESFRSEMAAGYALTEPTIVLGSPMLGDEVSADVRVQVALSRVNRHGLIAGRDRHRQDQDPPADRGPALRARRPGVRGRRQGRPLGHRRAGRRRRPSGQRPRTSPRVDLQAAGHPVEILSLSGKIGAHVRASVSSFGPLLLGKVLDLNDTQTSILSLVFRYCDDQQLPLLDLADLRTTLKFLGSDDGKPCSTTSAASARRSLGRDPAGDRDDRAGRRGRLLRRAGVRRRRPAAHDGRRQGHRDPARGRGRDGQAAAVLDVRAVDARPALRGAARGRRPPEAQARVLLRRGAPAVRRRLAGAARPDRADRPPDPLARASASTS